MITEQKLGPEVSFGLKTKESLRKLDFVEIVGMIQVFDTYSRKETLNNPKLLYFEVGFYRPLSTFEYNISHLSMFFFFYILLSTELNKIK